MRLKGEKHNNMAINTNVEEIEYLGEEITIDPSLIVDNKYQERNDSAELVTEYFMFTATTIDSATVSYDTGDPTGLAFVNFWLKKVQNINKTFALVVETGYNTSISMPRRTIVIDGEIHVNRNIGPHVPCHFEFELINECPIQHIDYVLSSEYVNQSNSHYFDDFFEKNSYQEFSSGDEDREIIYKILARKGNSGADSDYYTLLESADDSFYSTAKPYYVEPYEVTSFKRIIEKDKTYTIGPGLRSYGNSAIEPVEDVYDNDSHTGSLYFPSILHAIGYKTFSFCAHAHYGSSMGNNDCGSTNYFNGDVAYACHKNTDLKSKRFKEREYISNDNSANVTNYLKEIYVPSSTKIIGNQAFKYCTSLDNFGINDNGECRIRVIGMYAFEGCESLPNIPFSTSIEQIGEGAFKRSGIEEFNTSLHPMYNLGEIESSVFKECKKLKNIDLSGTRVKKIGRWAFKGCGTDSANGIETFNINTSNGLLERIESEAFKRCKINANVAIPSSVTNIGDRAFSRTVIQSIDFGTGNELIIEENAFFKTEVTSQNGMYIPPRIKKIPRGCFKYAISNHIEVSSDVISIGKEAFYGAQINYIQFNGNGNIMPDFSYSNYFIGPNSDCRLRASHAFIDNMIDKAIHKTSDLAEALYEQFYVTNKYDYTD